MAYICSDTRRKTKCRSFRKGSLGLWPCVLLKCLVSLPCIFTKCLSLDISVGLYPPGDLTILYGSPLEMFCIAENYTSKDIEFTFAGKPLPSEIVNSTTIRLYFEKPEKQANTYYCKNKKTKKICTSRVLVDSPPGDVTDFSCLSKNLDILNCSWTSAPEAQSNMNYTLTFSINGKSVQPCTVERYQNLKFCKWNTSSQPRYRQQSEQYFFHLRSCNVFGCNDQNITIDHFSIVRPDPPTDLKVLRNGTHSVVLQWSIPNNIVDFLTCGVDHKIEYQIAKYDNTAFFHSVDASSLPPNNKTYRFKLNNLPFAHMQYEVRIYIKSKKANDSLWSDFNYIVFYTASERPSRPPDTIAGAFVQAVYNNKRLVYIYWKQLEEYEEAGANFTYKVLVSQDNRNHTYFANESRSLSYVILDRASLGPIQATIWSFNMNGSSLNSSHLYIPPEHDTNSFGLTSFTKLAYENGTYELSWDGIENIDNYTLFWCQHNTTKICVGRLDFTVLEPHKNKHVIDLSRDYRFQFAISVNNGTKTSGMVWAKCDISKDGIAMYGFPVHLDYDAPGKSFVKLRWSMDCALQDGIITGYNITYCPVIRTSSFCDNAVGNQSVYISDPKKMDINITNLFPFRTYQFTIALNTIYGLKSIENTTAVITTSEDTPTSPRNVTVFNVKHDSLTISWDPPLHRNGNIGKYVIYNYGKEFHFVSLSGTDVSRRQVNLTGLTAFTNYSFTIQACNIPIGLCSKIDPNNATFVRTSIGPPGRMEAPTVKNSPDLLQWKKPKIPGGTVDLYQIRRVRDDKEPEIFNTTDLSYSITHCDGVLEGETYQVRAINFDDDLYHGVIAGNNVLLPKREGNSTLDEFPGEWSERSTVACKSRSGLTLTLTFVVVFVIVGSIYGSVKIYRKYKEMRNIKPRFPEGFGNPEIENTKYSFGGWNTPVIDDKPSSDEMLLLPNSKSTTVSTPENKQTDNDNCAASDHTISTALSDSSRGPIDKQASTSDDGSSSSLHLEIDPVKGKNDCTANKDENVSSSETESSRENSPCFSHKGFKKNPNTGYVQTVVNPASGYVQSAPAPLQNPSPEGSSYVMAGLSPSIFTTGVAPPNLTNRQPISGYVRPEDNQTKSMMNFPKLGPSPTKVFGPESLPIMPILPQPTKHGADSSYIQLRSLDALPSPKPNVRNTVPLKQTASSGYVSPRDAVLDKHLNNILSAGQLAEEPAILDPTMSPDAYCRFSWNTDPTNDNLHSLLADSPTINSSKN